MMHANRARFGTRALSLALWLAANVAIWLTANLYARWLGLLLLGGLLPGWLLFEHLYRGEQVDAVEGLLLIGGLGLGSLSLGALLLHAIPGPLARWIISLAYNMLVCALFFLRRPNTREVRLAWPRREALWALAAVAAVALATRFPNLGYSEFQGDEVAVIHMAASAAQGADEALYLHRKGPAETLIPLLTYATAHRMNEVVARGTFAFASLWAVLALYALGGRFLSSGAGTWAGLLMALNGFATAFGRIVQYQSLVMLYGALTVYCALAFAQSAKRRDLWLCALFGGLGLWAHTDAVFAVAVSALVAMAGLRRHFAPRAWARVLTGPLLFGTTLLAAFYVPYVLHPYFAQAREYVGLRLGKPPYDNLRYLVHIGTVYNSVYYLAALGAGLLAVALDGLRRFRSGRWILPVVALALLAQSWLIPTVWQAGGRSYVGLLYVAVLGLLLWAPARELGWRAALLWFALPFVAYMFLFGDPRTHVYALFPGAALLVGWGLAAAGNWLGRRCWLLYGPMAAVSVLSVGYLYIAFVSHHPEYRRTFPEHRAELYWTPWGEQMPQKGLFGFPYRAGWKAIGALYAQGVLRGDYGSNEEPHITNWYTRSAPWCGSYPRYYFVAKNVQDVQAVPLDLIAHEYSLVGRVWVGAEPKIEIYEHLDGRSPNALGYEDYRVEDYASAFDRELATLGYNPTVRVLDPLWDRAHVLDLHLGDRIMLVGYTLDRSTVRPGEVATVILYWRALAEVPESYAAFVHVTAEGTLRAQKDCAPVCGARPTTAWQAGELIRDPHPLYLREDVPPGRYALIAGMYAHASGEHLPVTSAEGGSLGLQVTLDSLEVVMP